MTTKIKTPRLTKLQLQAIERLYSDETTYSRIKRRSPGAKRRPEYRGSRLWADDDRGATWTSDRLAPRLLALGLIEEVEGFGHLYKLTAPGRELCAERAAARRAERDAKKAAEAAFDEEHGVFVVEGYVMVKVRAAVVARDEVEALAAFKAPGASERSDAIAAVVSESFDEDDEGALSRVLVERVTRAAKASASKVKARYWAARDVARHGDEADDE